MNTKAKTLVELKKLLSKSSAYYKKIIIDKNQRFDFKKPVILFGAAKLSDVFIKFFKKKYTKILALSDNNKNLIGKKIDNIKIISKNEIKKLYGQNVQIVATSYFYEEILKDLKKIGFKRLFDPMYFSTLFSKDFDVLIWKNNIDLILRNKKAIYRVYDYLIDDESRKIFLNILKFRLTQDKKLFKKIRTSNSEYFDKKIIKLSKNEAFVDGGAYDGDTIKLIIKESKNKFKKIFAFEPDELNFKKITNYIHTLHDSRISVFKLGLGDKNNTLNFTNEGNLQSKVVKSSGVKICIVPIDKYINEEFSYIKLDIEGFEKKALIGSKNTIKKYKPKLVICAYHNLNDLWELPILIKSAHPGYKIYFRHYTDFLMDTICYAV